MSVKDEGEVSATGDTVAAERTETATDDTRLAPAEPVSGTAPTRIQGGAPTHQSRPPLERGMKLGRYVVLDELGAGGLGIVVRAFDPELERQVAIKLVRIELASNRGRARERLMREAQAVAQLAHPNVVSVHDVGTVGDEVFVAMELVEGKPLSKWLRGDHTTAEVLDVFEQAAAGLIAAHDRGLIHRDFKPDNVLVGEDGRVRVVDFGLARALDTADAEAGEPGTSGPGVSLTHTGAVMGTPAYMAPEQHRGDAVDARADQYAFCVSLYEALAGARPFRGDTYAELATKVLAGTRDESRDDALPRRVAPVVERGMALDPGDRYATMADLLAALRTARATRRTARLAALGGIVAVGAAIAFTVLPSDQDKTCTGGNQAMTAIWNDDVRADVRAAFERSGVAYRGPVLERVESDLDEYTLAWATMHREACEATRVRHTQSERVLDLRNACLDRRRAELATLIGYLAKADAAVVDRGSRATASLSRISDCADVTDQLLVRGPPDTPEAKELAAMLGEAKAHRMAGKLEVAETIAADALERARAAGWVSLEADAMFTRGVIRLFRQELDTARTDLLDAYVLAEASLDQVLKARIASQLASLHADQPGGLAQALQWIRQGRACLASVGGRDQWEANLDATEAVVLLRDGDPERAIALFDRSIATRTRLFGPDDLDVAVDLGNRSSALTELGRNEEALEDVRKAMEIMDGVVGPRHPIGVQMRQSYGHSLMRIGALDEAEALLREAVLLHEAVFGETSPTTLHARIVLGMCLSRQGRQDEAIALFDQTLARAEDSGQKDTAIYGDALAALADAYQLKGNNALSWAKFVEARDIAKRIYGADNPVTLRASMNAANQLVAMGNYDSALVELAELAMLVESKLGKEHRLFAKVQHDQARAYIGIGKHSEAIAALEAALAFYERHPEDFMDRAIVQHQLAILLWEENLGRPRAVRLAESSRDMFRAAGNDLAAANLVEVEAWLASHRLD